MLAVKKSGGEKARSQVYRAPVQSKIYHRKTSQQRDSQNWNCPMYIELTAMSM